MSYKTMAIATDDKHSTRCCAWKLAAALLVLRLCLGTHFFSEGTKKLAYDNVNQEWALNSDFIASTENLFRGATGPLANVYKNLVPGFYDWENLLAVPRQAEPLAEEQIAGRQSWHHEYETRRKAAAADKETVPIEFPEYASYKDWGEKIVEGMRSKLKSFTDLSGISDEQDAAAADVFVARHQQLADFLEEESQGIEDYQHELWRLQQMQDQSGSREIPFRQERVAAKRSETIGLGNRLVSEVRGIERGYNNDLRALLSDEQRSDASLVENVEKAVTSAKSRRFYWLNLAVACTIIGVGVCLLLGLFTRLAAIGAIVFLVSVMVTQLPWVPGAKSMLFYYQLAECAALLTLVASRPSRLPGVDYVLSGLWNKCCGKKG